MDSMLKEKDNKPIELVKSTSINPTAIIVDSRTCLIDSLTQGLRESALFKNVQTCKSLNALLNNFDKEKKDISMVILCASIDGANNLNDCIKDIKNAFASDTRIVLLADNPDTAMVARVSEFNISGLIPTNYTTNQVLACLKAIDAGIQFVPSELMTDKTSHPTMQRLMMQSSTRSDMHETLTPRQAEVLELLCVGRSNKYIAAELSLCESTVKVHVSEIMKRLGATSRTHASYLYKQMLDEDIKATTDTE